MKQDTNLTYDSCKNCDKLEAEICRLEMIWETERGDNNRLKKELNQMTNANIANYDICHSQSLRTNEIERNAEMINEINNSLNQEVQKWKDKHYTAMQRIVELESAFAGAEEMVKDKIKLVEEFGSENERLKEVIEELINVKRFNNT